MNATAGGRGDTILYENHTCGPRVSDFGMTDKISDKWKISEERLKFKVNKYGA